MPGTTWDVLDKHPSIGLSSLDLTATASTSGDNGIRCKHPVTTGKYYTELSVGTFSGAIGLSAGGNAWTDIYNFATGALVIYSSGAIWFNGSSTGINIGNPAGKKLRIALDCDNSRAWLAVDGGNYNNNGSANPATNTGGIDISAYAGRPWCLAAVLQTSGNSVAANTGDSAFTYSVPSGFTSGWPASARTEGVAFDPTLSDAAIVLSNGGMTASIASGTEKIAFTARTLLSTDKVYFEFFINSVGSSGNNGVGISADDASAADIVLGCIDGAMLFKAGSIFVDSTTRTSAFQAQGATASGHINAVALDMTTNKYWTRRLGGLFNDGGTANPATGVGGYDISTLVLPIGAVARIADSGQVVSLNTSTMHKTLPPAGFTVGLLPPAAALVKNTAVTIING